MYAATSVGLLRSNVDGAQWEPVRTLNLPEPRFIAVQRGELLAAGLRRLALSQDGGVRWTQLAMPAGLTQIAAVALDDQRTIWVGGREGLFYSSDGGKSWQPLKDLKINEVDSVHFDPVGARVLITCSNSNVVYAVNTVSHALSYWDSGWRLRFVRPVADYLLGITLFDGVVVQPRMVDSAVSTAKDGGH
jgi:hypothetical protein